MTFTLTSWNILADAYIRPRYYPNTPAEILRPERRRRALVAFLERLRTDVLCLQEVEEDAYSEIRDALAPTYESRFLQKSGGKPDGCATFWREFDLSLSEEFHYPDGSGHVALIVHLRRGDRTMVVANTHLKWSPPEDRVGAVQMTALLDGRSGLPDIVCGDFNVTPESEVVQVLRERGMSFVHPPESFTCNSNQKAKKIDFIFHGRSLKARPFDMARIDDHSALPSGDCPSDHLPVQAEFDD